MNEKDKRLPLGSIRPFTKEEKEWKKVEEKEPKLKERVLRIDDLIDKQVVDLEGYDIGYVDEFDGEFLLLREGPFGEDMRIHKSYIGRVNRRVILADALREIVTGLDVIDADGKKIGVIKEIIGTEDCIDMFIVDRGKDKEMLNVLLERIHTLGVNVILDLKERDLEFENQSYKMTFKEKLKRFFER